jgi:hypothetical protein
MIIMKSIYKIIISFVCILLFCSCNDILDLEPKDKLDGKAMFSDPEGVKLYMANLYSQLPIEDFKFTRLGFNNRSGQESMMTAMFTDEASHSEFGDFISIANNPWWDEGYKLIRDVNILVNEIPTINVSETQRKAMMGESAFIKAYSYYALAKRYGGVPLIDEVQKWEGDVEALKVPRSTEKDTWDYVLIQCDIAAENLPLSWDGGERRATKWVALALKSRVALHAASIAKYGDRTPMSGAAVDQKLVGIDKQYANAYYEAVIKAAEELIISQRFSLYKPNPANPEEAAENYRKLFEDPNQAPEEAMFIKGYMTDLGHSYDGWYGPRQTSNNWWFPGRMNPTLEFMDMYENYNNPGVSSPLKTSPDADDLTNYNGFNASKNYYHFDSPNGIFEGKDARLWGTAVLPGTYWKGKQIIIQAGFVKPDGTAQILSGNPYIHNGVTYTIYGSSDITQFSGFYPSGNYTRTGASFKKFLDQNNDVVLGWSKSLTDYADFRFAEVLLNYAEAVVESGYNAGGAQTNATIALNYIRHRAGHTVDIPLTVDNVQRERLVELSFENKRFWDLMRRREYHTLFANSRMHALQPVIDLRVSPPKWIFIRANIRNMNNRTFDYRQYYRSIPGITTNGLIQNPQY